MTVARVRARFYALPLRRAVRGVRSRAGWIVEITDLQGRVGLGDVAPWPGMGSPLPRVEAALAELNPATLSARSLTAIEAVVSRHRSVPEVAWGVELALLDLYGQSCGLPIAALFTDAPHRQVPVNGLFPGEVAPFPCVKAKVGHLDPREVAAFTADVRSALGPKVLLRLDANGAWDRETALAVLDGLAPLGLEWIEQPVRDLADLAWLRERSSVPIAADEAVRSLSELERAIALRAADVLVVKPALVGGLIRAREMAGVARAAGLQVVVTSMLESAVGRTGALHLAASLPGALPHCGLSDPLTQDLASAPTPGRLPSGSGLGLTLSWPDPWAVPNPLATAAIADPERVALEDGAGRRWTARALADVAARVATTLARRGVTPGDRVRLTGPTDGRLVVCLHGVGWLGASVGGAPEAPGALEVATEELLVDAEDAWAMVERPWPLDEERFSVQTSGTTGEPRRVGITTGQLLFGAFGSAVRLGHDPEDRWLCCLPLRHVGGLAILYRCALYGTGVLLHPRFDAARVNRALDTGAATMVSLVPAMLAAVLDDRQERPFAPSLRVILLGGGRAPAPLLARCAAIGAPVHVTWGMTEAGSQIATRPAGAPSHAVPPLPFARVVSHDGALVVTGPVVGGALLTADAGEIGEDGWVTVHGRRDDIIISGGEHIHPAVVERALRSHPAVLDAAVVAVPHDRWGQRPEAAVVVAASADLPRPEALARWCEQRLASFEVPDRFHFVDALARDGLGKLFRARVRQQLQKQGVIPHG